MRHQIYPATYNPEYNSLNLWGIDAPKGEVVQVNGDPMILTSKVKGHRTVYEVNEVNEVYEVYEVIGTPKLEPNNTLTLKLKRLTVLDVQWDGKPILSPMFKDYLN